jgi:adenosylhomocysteinase
MKSQNTTVYVVEAYPIGASQAHTEGYIIDRLYNTVHDIDIFVTDTGNKDIITAKDT